MTILLVADHDGAALSDATARALTAALAMNEEIHLFVAGNGVAGVAQAAAALTGVAKVLCADDPALANQLAEPVSAVVARVATDYEVVVLPATSFGKSVAPRVAALLDVMQISEAIKVHSKDTFDRPIYAGNAIQTVRSKNSKRVVTIRPSAFARRGGAAQPRSRQSWSKVGRRWRSSKALKSSKTIGRS